jgi:hypothetical protein
MKLKKWKEFININESKIEFNTIWNLNEDDIRDYLQESIDEGYQIEVEFGFVGKKKIWNYKDNKYNTQERFTKNMISGNNTSAISIVIRSEGVSDIDVSTNLKFAYSIISEEADAEIKLLDGDGELGNIDGIIAKGGLFFTDTWNENPKVQELEGHLEFLVMQKEDVKITQKQLAEYYKWGSYETKGDLIFVDYSLEDLADEILKRDSRYKDLLIHEGDIYDNYFGSDYQPDLISLFQYYLDKDNEVLLVKTIIKEIGGFNQFINQIGKEELKEMKEEELIDYLLKERFYRTLKDISSDSEILGDVKQSYGDWASQAHADTNLEEIRSAFDKILNDNFTYEKGTREVEKNSKYKDENGNTRTYTELETFYLIQFSNDWIEDMEIDDLENERLTNIFQQYIYNNDMTGYELKPYFSDYGNVDEKAWNKDIKSDLLRFLNK